MKMSTNNCFLRLRADQKIISQSITYHPKFKKLVKDKSILNGFQYPVC